MLRLQLACRIAETASRHVSCRGTLCILLCGAPLLLHCRLVHVEERPTLNMLQRKCIQQHTFKHGGAGDLSVAQTEAAAKPSILFSSSHHVRRSLFFFS